MIWAAHEVFCFINQKNLINPNKFLFIYFSLFTWTRLFNWNLIETDLVSYDLSM
jgi:hypothetical protein